MEIVIAAVLGWLFLGPTKPKSKPTDNGGSKLPGDKPTTTPSAPNWMGFAGVQHWQVLRDGARWKWSISPGGPGTNNGTSDTPIAAIRNAIGAAISADGAADYFAAIPRPAKPRQLSATAFWDGATHDWGWAAGELAKGFPDLLGKLNAEQAAASLHNLPATASIAGGAKATRDEAIAEMVSWLGDTASGAT